MNRRRAKEARVPGRSVAGVESKRSKRIIRDVMRRQVDFWREGGDAKEEEGEEGEKGEEGEEGEGDD